ncbi:MAG TPA: hypothetical protein VGR26_08405 [Acidimicrobiales bacterium]|nr:hypothetical protein [Acidimicrobiales bacterium]
MRRRRVLTSLTALAFVLASCNGGAGGMLSRAPEKTSTIEGGPFCGPLQDLNRAKLDLIRRATSNLDIDDTADRIRGLQEQVVTEAPAEVREQARFTTEVYGEYLDVLQNEGYGKAPFEKITSDEFNAAELALVSYCFQNPTS